MTGQHGDGHGGERVTLVLGAVLVVLGVLFLAGPALDIDLGELDWPVFVIVPGVALLVVGLLSSGPVGLGMTVPGSIVTVVGLILFYQNSTDRWDSWAYAWALIPAAIGLGTAAWGLLHRRPTEFRAGAGALFVGLVLFVIFGAFFEGVLGLGGDGFGAVSELLLPVLLIGAGVLLVAMNLLRNRASRAAPPGRQPGRQPPAAPG